MRTALPVCLLLLAAACSSSSPTTSASPADDAGTVDPPAAPPPATPDVDAGTDAGLTGVCADTFGSALTAGFGRIDGIVYAVQKPSDTQCAMPNNDHVVVQVLMNGAVYRMVVNVSASAQNPTIRTAQLDHALPAPAWSEGWHLGAALDYVTTLDVHTAAFQTTAMNDAVSTLATQIHVGDPISVYATSGDGRPESAHLVHRNKTNEDGAIVLSPATAPHLLLFAFDNQTF